MERVVVSTVLALAKPQFEGQKPFDLVSVASLKAEFNLTGSEKDAALKTWITQESAAAAKFCDRVFAIETVQDRIFPARDSFPVREAIGGEEPLQLSRCPIAAVPSAAGIAPPIAPALSAVSGGSVPGSFFAKVSYVTAAGETAASLESQLVLASGLLQVASPAADPGGLATGWNCYLGSQSFAETLQNSAPLPIGTPFTLPASGLATTGTALPSYVLVVENNVPLAEGVDFLAKKAAGQLVRLNPTYGFPRRWHAAPIIVQAPLGYDLEEPDFADAQKAVTLMVKGRLYSQERDPMLRSETMPGAYEAQYWFASGPGSAVGNLTPDVQALLEKYRTPVFG